MWFQPRRLDADRHHRLTRDRDAIGQRGKQRRTDHRFGRPDQRNPVIHVRREARQPERIGEIAALLAHLRIAEQRLAPVRSDDPERDLPLPAIQPDQIACMDQRAMPLMERDPGGEFAGLAVPERTEIRLDTEMPEHRSRHARRHRHAPPGDVAIGRPDMRAHHLGGEEGRQSALDHEAIERIVRVRGPHPVGQVEDREIGAPAPARTTLDLDRRMRRAEPCEQVVQPEHMRMRPATPIRVAGMAEIAVHVPFEIGDGIVAEQRIDRGEQMVAHCSAPEIEHELMAEAELRRGRCRQHPFGMRAEEVAVGIDHLGFDPQPELHPERTDMLDQRPEPVGIDATMPGCGCFGRRR